MDIFYTLRFPEEVINAYFHPYFSSHYAASCLYGRRVKDKKEVGEPEADPERDQRTVFAYQVDGL